MKDIINTIEHDINNGIRLQLNKFYSGSDICEEAILIYPEGQMIHLDIITIDTSSDYEPIKFHLWDVGYVYTCYYDNNRRLTVDKSFDIVSRKYVNIFEECESKLTKKNKYI